MANKVQKGDADLGGTLVQDGDITATNTGPSGDGKLKAVKIIIKPWKV